MVKSSMIPTESQDALTPACATAPPCAEAASWCVRPCVAPRASLSDTSVFLCSAARILASNASGACAGVCVGIKHARRHACTLTHAPTPTHPCLHPPQRLPHRPLCIRVRAPSPRFGSRHQGQQGLDRARRHGLGWRCRGRGRSDGGLSRRRRV